MKNNIKKAVEKYQCPGCTVGSNISCYQQYDTNGNQGCKKHVPGTMIMPYPGTVILGLPAGFTRLGDSKRVDVCIFEKLEDGWGFDKFNIPIWKYFDKKSKHTLVKVISPRINYITVHVFLENCVDKINCLEITQEDIDGMD